ncbi:hypothetical protein GW17_00012326 [Ensete ventricosum]|nr:hypothetical protein GW17_00012326 [Ensete ventricosum]
MDDRVFVPIPRHDRNSTPWSIRTFSSAWKGYVCDSTCGGIEAQDPDNGAPILAKCDPRVGSSTIQRTRPMGLSYPKAKRRLERMWTQRSTTVSQRWIYQSRRKGCRCKITDSRAMGLAAPWYRRGETSVESSIPCSHGGRALVIKGAKEV